MSIAACLISIRGWFRRDAQVVIASARSGFEEARVFLKRLLDFLRHVERNWLNFSIDYAIVGAYNVAVVVEIVLIVLYVRLPAVDRVAKAVFLSANCEGIFRDYLADSDFLVR